MAHEAFALSPISARATLPSEEDYEAISQAFMETSRGRWFLGEYAKRNRNADTRLVLDAVERIEQTIAAQKQQASDKELKDAWAAIRRAGDEAQAAAAVAVDGLALEENISPVRKGARIIKEISWRWREIGADSRICDLLDSQVGAIEFACEHIASSSPHAALAAAFSLIKARLAEFGEDEAATPQAPQVVVPLNSTSASGGAQVAVAETSAAANKAKAASPVLAKAAAETVKVAAVMTATADAKVEGPDVSAQSAGENPDDAEPYDEALLDMVALEMGAPDPDGVDDIDFISDVPVAAAREVHAAARPPVERAIAVKMPEPPARPRAVRASPQPSLQPASPDARPLSQPPSLGSSLIASGIVRSRPPRRPIRWRRSAA